MRNDVIFIADLFKKDVQRGAELNDDALINKLGISKKIHCKDIDYINKDNIYIIGNFVTLSEYHKNALISNGNYIIYEHDHKYVASRNPFIYKNWKVPKYKLINVDFYEGAKSVICLTDFHQNQLQSTSINFKDIVNIHGSLWSDDDLNILESNSKIPKIDKCAIYSGSSNSSNFKDTKNMKNFDYALEYCVKNALKYRIIPRMSSRYKFLNTLGKFKSISFFPKIPESCSRLLTESKMMGLEVYTNLNSGAINEYWWKLSPEEIITEFRNKIIPNAINIFKERLT